MLQHRLTIVLLIPAAMAVSCSHPNEPERPTAPVRTNATDTKPAQPRPVGPLTLALAAKQKTYVWGQPMMVEARLKNVSDSTPKLNPFWPMGGAWTVSMGSGSTYFRPPPGSKEDDKRKWDTILCGRKFYNWSNVNVAVRRLTGTPRLDGIRYETDCDPYEQQPFELPPGEERVYQFDLDKACSDECINGPGRFEVSVSYSARSSIVTNRTNQRTGERTTTTEPGRSWQGSIRSNPIVVEVVEPPEAPR